MELKVAKKDILSSLSNIKIVMGNGFDMFCNLKSSYEDFFKTRKEYHSLFINLRLYCYTNYSACLEYFNYPFVDNDIKTNELIKANVWDLFFFLNSTDLSDKEDQIYNQDKKWCDIESSMKASFVKSKINTQTKIYWSSIFKELKNQDNHSHLSLETFTLASFIKVQKILDLENLDEEHFYNYLLSQLKNFENDFGNYIKNQCDTDNYKFNFDLTLRKLTSDRYNEINSIDTFNYSFYDNENFIYIMRNINGNYNNPIFGIDSQGIEDSSPIYIFTKTSRRIEMQINSLSPLYDLDFKDVIIFGHSLSSNDYGYFYPLLENLKKDSKLIFAYSIYRPDQEEKIKKDLQMNVIKLINSYEKYTTNKNTYRLIDSLTFKNNILFMKIDEKNIKKQ